jgi:D-arabinose 1-dehydrogenase-like Zn-dependent alcohol dehydrogenase
MQSYVVETFGKPLAQALRDTPTPTGTQVILRVGSCGVCHSDVHLHDGYFDLGQGNKMDLTRAMNLPRAMGHEIAGTVVAVGPDAQGVAVGDQRVVYPWLGCGSCTVCLAGEEQICAKPRALGIQQDGGFADHVVVPHAKYLVDYGDLPEEQACTYACSGLTGYGALKKVGTLGQDDPLLIIGAGGVGLSGIRLAAQMFARPPIVAELDKSKWDVARAAGAGELIDPSAAGAGRELFQATGGGVAAVVDFVGASSSFEFGYNALRKGGTLVVVGLFGGSVSFSPTNLVMRAVNVRSSYVGSLADMNELMAIARAGKLPPLPLTSQPLAQATQALDDLRAGRIKGRTILKP